MGCVPPVHSEPRAHKKGPPGAATNKVFFPHPCRGGASAVSPQGVHVSPIPAAGGGGPHHMCAPGSVPASIASHAMPHPHAHPCCSSATLFDVDVPMHAAPCLPADSLQGGGVRQHRGRGSCCRFVQEAGLPLL